MTASQPGVLPLHGHFHIEKQLFRNVEDDIYDPFVAAFPVRPVDFRTRFEIIENAAADSDSPVLRVYDHELEMECAFKILSKKQILSRGWKTVEQANQEARIMRKLNHTFIVSFLSSWQTRTKLLIAMEYLPGGELYYLWKRLRIVSDSLIRFFAAQVTVALDYLHTKDVVYRDLKMENLMFDSRGYLKLIDFGASKELSTYSMEKTWTICGTLAYCAPEMLNGDGYDFRVDWWSLGIMCYALSSGTYPVTPGRDHQHMRDNVNKHTYVVPYHVSSSLEQTIHKLLRKDPRKRVYGKNALEKLNFFAGMINFDRVEDQQYDPRAFYTEADVAKLNEGPMKSWIMQYQQYMPRKSEEVRIQYRGGEISIVRSPTVQSRARSSRAKTHKHTEQHKVSPWLLVQPEVISSSNLSSYIQFSDLSDSTRSVTTNRTSKSSFNQSIGSIARGATSNSSIGSNLHRLAYSVNRHRSENEQNSTTPHISRKSTARSRGQVSHEDSFVITCDSPIGMLGKRPSIRAMWDSFKERISRVGSRRTSTRSRCTSLANRGPDRDKDHTIIERKVDTGPLELYINVNRAPTYQRSVQSNSSHRQGSTYVSKTEMNGQTERVIYIKPR